MSVTRVTFKDETEIDGEPAGPVTLIDEAMYDADPVVVEQRESGKPGLPYGYTPQGVTKLTPWRTRTEALALAAQYGVTLTET